MAAPTMANQPWRTRKLTRSRIKLRLPVTPVVLMLGVSLLIAGFSVAFAILEWTLALLILELITLGAYAWVFIDMHRTGHYWNVPYSSHPEHRGRR